jgi:ribosomal-protein-alanine N-acetyltransferase
VNSLKIFKIYSPGEALDFYSEILQLESECFQDFKWTDEGVKYHLINNHTLLCMVGNILVGYVFYVEGIWDLEILRIGTTLKNRNSGVGSEFLSILKKTKKPILLEVKENNAPAIYLYEKMKFLKIGTRKKYYADGTDALIYYLKEESLI